MPRLRHRAICGNPPHPDLPRKGGGARKKCESSGAMRERGLLLLRSLLHREMGAQLALDHVLLAAGEDDFAALHDGEAVGEVAGEVKILLDEQYGDVAARGK